MVAVVEMAVEHAIVAGFADLAQDPADVDIEVAAGSADAAVVEFLYYLKLLLLLMLSYHFIFHSDIHSKLMKSNFQCGSIIVFSK